MIKVGNTEISYNYMGLFTINEEWMHPQVCEKTYEIIYVISGEVNLFEKDTIYELKENDLVVLAPGILHGGSRRSLGHTSFYWIHFTLNNKERAFDSCLIRNFQNRALFKEMLHHSHTPNAPLYVKESCLCHLLSAIAMSNEPSCVSALARDVFEWTRINARSGLTVREIADRFGYNPEHISRLIKREYGTTLKSLVDEFLIGNAKNYLSNSDCSVKEVSALLGFSTPNTFIHFFKYHEKISPTRYRNLYTHTHMNKK